MESLSFRNSSLPRQVILRPRDTVTAKVLRNKHRHPPLHPGMEASLLGRLPWPFAAVAVFGSELDIKGLAYSASPDDYF